MSAHFSADAITDELWVGSYPADEADWILLRDGYGVEAVLNLQTDDDLRGEGLLSSVAWKLAMGSGLTVERVPITDFRPEEVQRSLVPAVAALHALASEHARVFVHCTAGMNRSPTILLAYLILNAGWTVEQALERGLAARSVIRPYVQVLRDVAARRERLWPLVVEAARQL
jgi:hypothetical protein